MTVRFWRTLMETPSQDFFLSNCPYPVFAMNPQVREYLWQHSLSGMRTLTLDYWMIFRGTTLLNSSPPLVGRHAVRTAPSQARFSLSATFAIRPGASNSTWIFGPENKGRIHFQRSFFLAVFLSWLSISSMPILYKIKLKLKNIFFSWKVASEHTMYYRDATVQGT